MRRAAGARRALVARRGASWKYAQRVRCSRLPPVVARLRSWPEAPATSASDEHRIALAHQRVRGQVASCAPPRRCASHRRLARSMASNGSRVTSTSSSGRGDPELHVVDEVRAAAEERRARPAGDQRHRGLRRRSAARNSNGLIAPPPARSPRRCSRRRRSGRGCRSSARGSPPRVSSGRRATSGVTWLGQPALDLGQHPDRRADLARRAVSALEAVVVEERALHRVQVVGRCQARRR